MNFIDINNDRIRKAKNHHFEKLFIPILTKIEKSTSPFRKYFEDFIANNLEVILIGLPDRLIELHTENKDFLECPPILSEIKKVFDYKYKFGKISGGINSYSAYELAQNLNIQTCTYCNRMYTKTVITTKNEKITRPQFDHWYPKNEYPLFALSFYNLIPSCGVCNCNIKGKTPLSLKSHLHPYVMHDVNMKFSYDLNTYNKYEFKIKSNGDSKVKNTIDFFKIKEIYETHLEEIEDLIKVKRHYSSSYLSNLKSILRDTNISQDEIYRLAFGVYFNEDDFEKRPLSRMKKDILIELGIISKNTSFFQC